MTRDQLKPSVVAAYTTIGFLIVFGSNSGCSTRGKTEEGKAPTSTNKPKIRPLTDIVFERSEYASSGANISPKVCFNVHLSHGSRLEGSGCASCGGQEGQRPRLER